MVVKETMHILLYRAFHAQRNILRPCMRQLGLGAGQPKIVVYLDEHGPCRQRDLADYFEVDPAAISRMLESLEKGGFVTVAADENHRRCNLVKATERGRQAGQAWLEKCAQAEEIMLQGFAPEEREAFRDYLIRARDNFANWREEHPCET